MTKLLDGGLDITAIHNHILRASPATFYMHVGSHGDPEKMASVIRSALSSASKTPFDPPAANPSPTPAIDLDTAKLDAIMRVRGTTPNGGVYQFGVPRPPITFYYHDPKSTLKPLSARPQLSEDRPYLRLLRTIFKRASPRTLEPLT
jgi:hypothetical protein